LFVLPGSALWALLPLVANRALGLGAGGYGLLLAALGIGAVAGAVLLPRLAACFAAGGIVAAASAVFAVAEVACAVVGDVTLVVLLLFPAGAAWLIVLSPLSAANQVFLPRWVRARGLSMQQIVMMGGQAVGALIWGLVADHAGLTTALLGGATLMVLGAATLPFWPLMDTSGMRRESRVYWPEPLLIADSEPDEGPVLIISSFAVPPANTERFISAMERVQASRRRTGATRWNLYRDAADPQRFVETFLVPSWEEHLRQHHDRLTATDQDIEGEAVRLASRPPDVAHLLRAR
jgi:MFS family permease